MRTSRNGINLIKQHEGCRLTAYKCAAGVWTIGYGHTAGVSAGMKITREQAESYLKNDLAKYETKVAKYDNTYHWNQNEYDALASFAYNIGSIDQLTANGIRSRAEIASKIPAYNKAAGRELAGLTSRRKMEQALFKTPCGASASSGNIQAAEAGHVQLNYKAGDTYTVQVDSLLIRTKPSEETGQAVKGKKIGSLKKGAKVKNLATMRAGEEIWMFIGLDSQKREKWICADNGVKVYVG